MSTLVRPSGPKVNPVRAAVLARRSRLEIFEQIAREHPGLAYFSIFGEQVYLVSEPDINREVLVTQGRSFAKGRGLEQAKRVLGTGLLTSEGAEHMRARRLAQPAFHHQRITAYSSAMVSVARERSATWQDGQHVDLAAEMASLTLDIVGRALFGSDLTDDSREVSGALTEFLEAFDVLLTPLGQVMLKVPSPLRRRLASAKARLDAVVYRMIATHRAGGGDPDDLLSLLLAARDEETGGSTFTDEQLRDEVLTLVLAGHETTANALAWCFWHLSRTPQALAALLSEVDALGHAPEPGDLAALPVTTATIAESIRLTPPAWAIGRRALVDVELGGFAVPAGALVLVCPWVMQRDARWWGEDVLDFRPSRWLRGGAFDEAAPGQPRGAWFPFGAGTRVCIGESFAWTEAVLVLATLVRDWSFVVDTGYAPTPKPAITLRPGGGVPAVLRSRPKAGPPGE